MPENITIDEFKEAGIATKCFPTLFPFGFGDPTSIYTDLKQDWINED